MAGTGRGSVYPATGAEPAPTLQGLARRLFTVLSDGASGLRFNIRRGYALRDGAGHQGIHSSLTTEWRPARDLRPDGTEVDRVANPWVLERHLRGDYDVAIEAPSWSSFFILDIDRPHVPQRRDAPVDLEAEIRANLQRDDVLASVWRAFQLGPERLPVILATPGGGYHLYFPLCRDEQARPEQFQWPLRFARQHVEHHLNQARLGLRPGVLELYPSGVPLRAPCGRGTSLLVPRNPQDPDRLELEPLHVKRSSSGRLARDILPMVGSFLEQLEAARRPLEAWLSPAPHRPAWDAVRYGPYGLREKNDPARDRGCVLSQHNEEVDPAVPAGAPVQGVAGPVSSLVPLSSSAPFQLPSGSAPVFARGAEDVREAVPPGGEGLLLYGKAYLRRVTRLLTGGIRRKRIRHDALLKVTYYFGQILGMDEAAALVCIEDWLRSRPHDSTTRQLRGDEKFVVQSLREARHYLRRFGRGARRRRPAVASRPLRRTLAPADIALVAKLVPDGCRAAGLAILTYLAGFADAKGRVPQPVALSSQILTELCGEDRIISERGARSRVSVVAMAYLQQAGLLTVHTDYSTTHHGRRYCVWYRFGSGDPLPNDVSLGGVVLGRRAVEEGELICVSDGRRARAILHPTRGVRRDGPESWWRKLYENRAFTPAEFFDADERHVLAGPFRDRRPPGSPSRSRLRAALGALAAPAGADASAASRPTAEGLTHPELHSPSTVPEEKIAAFDNTAERVAQSPLRSALERAWSAWGQGRRQNE